MRVSSSLSLPFWLCACAAIVAGADDQTSDAEEVLVSNGDPLIFYNGRWDFTPETWWTGSGFKLHVNNLQSLTLNLGPYNSDPVALGVSVNYGTFYTVNATQGANVIPLNGSLPAGSNSVIRINSEGWEDNHMNLESIKLNAGASLLPYTPSKLAFQFIGDSLSAGQYLDEGVDQAWPFLTGEYLKAEHNIQAQPGIALSNIVSYGNENGMIYQFFCTEDDEYFYDPLHNYTTPWDFARDIPTPTHVVILIGANDSGNNITSVSFYETYLEFFDKIRRIYVTQPVFVFLPWGWPSPDAPPSQYYTDIYPKIVDYRHSIGDENVYLVNATGWISYADVFPSNLHPTVQGHQIIAANFESYLEQWGLQPESEWATPV